MKAALVLLAFGLGFLGLANPTAAQEGVCKKCDADAAGEPICKDASDWGDWEFGRQQCTIERKCTLWIFCYDRCRLYGANCHQYADTLRGLVGGEDSVVVSCVPVRYLRTPPIVPTASVS